MQEYGGNVLKGAMTRVTFGGAVDVMAARDTLVICAFGDSITDGTHTTLNTNDRWADVLSRRRHDAYGHRVSVVNPVVANAAAGPAAVDRLDRDVLGLSGLTHVIWLEGINDLGAARPTDDIVAGYKTDRLPCIASRVDC